MSDELFPMRDIQHAIDLVSEAILHNFSHYMMNPTDHGEFRRHVDELLRKCLIRESMSPCAILVLLSLKTDGS